jgi:ring-1,2-phenylacetyl-CoA epoxidase subunit PaaC
MNFSEKEFEAIKELLYKMADDQLILGHRNSEWTGLGPVLEEDIAFSSMAQDKIGQSLALYDILHQMGEKDADTVAFMRNAEQFHCCHLVEYPIGEYDFSLVRHFFFDYAEWVRFSMLAESSFEPLSLLARKFKGEVKYHTMHAKIWIEKLGKANEESHQRIQEAINKTFPMALGIFEPGPNEVLLKSSGVFQGEAEAQKLWLALIQPIVAEAGLKLPELSNTKPAFGGRKGTHTEHLQPMLDEMTEVFRIDPAAEW